MINNILFRGVIFWIYFVLIMALLRVGRLNTGFRRFTAPIFQNTVSPFIGNTQTTIRSYCEAPEDEDEFGGVPEGEEWMMLRQAKKTSKKRLEAKRKGAKAWRNITFQAWTHMYRPEHAKYMLKTLKEQSKYDDIVLTPKHGERFMRVWRARRIQAHNHARENKVFPKRR